MSFTAIKISSTSHLYLQFYMSAFYVSCHESGSFGYLLFTFSHVTLVYMFLQYIQRLYQSSLGSADHALIHALILQWLPSHLKGHTFDHRQA
jgi:hypothetical protein